MKKKIFFLMAIIIIFMSTILNNSLYAKQVTQPGVISEEEQNKTNKEIRDERNELNKGTDSEDEEKFWSSASEWFGKTKKNETPTGIKEVMSTFTKMINVVGTTVIIIATVILGIKYIIGTVESQTSAKEGLITLFVACIFFFGWTSISNLLFPNNNFIFTSTSDISYKNMVGRILSTFTYIADFVIVAVIIYVGIKYIFAGATGKAELKGKSVYFIIGIILVFATTNVLSFISTIINQTI